jgi:hypothetical protein
MTWKVIKSQHTIVAAAIEAFQIAIKAANKELDAANAQNNARPQFESKAGGRQIGVSNADNVTSQRTVKEARKKLADELRKIANQIEYS